MSSNESDLKKAETLAKKATDPLQYDSVVLDWEKEGMLDSPTRQFFHGPKYKQFEGKPLCHLLVFKCHK